VRGFARTPGRRLACIVRLMSSHPSHHTGPWTSSRLVDLLFGIFLAVLAAVILVLSDQSSFAGSIVAAGVVGGLGIEAMFSAMRGKRSFLARIGPLP
jgi:hypothetical protein